MRVPGSFLDGGRGKLGNLVGSKNASGNYLRKYAKPTNPSSIAQQNARTLFHSVHGAWNALTATLIQSWNSFATNGFNALRSTNHGQYTGKMAFSGIKASVGNANLRIQLSTISINLLTTAVAQTSGPFVFNDTPPVSTVRPSIFDTATSSFPIQLASATLSSAGALTGTFTCVGAPTAGLTLGDLKDDNGLFFGLAFYLSDPVKAVGQIVKNPFFYSLGNTGVVTFTTTKMVAAKTFKVTMSCANVIPNFKSFPVTGNVCKITAVAIGSNGTQAVINSQYVTLT